MLIFCLKEFKIRREDESEEKGIKEIHTTVQMIIYQEHLWATQKVYILDDLFSFQWEGSKEQ